MPEGKSSSYNGHKKWLDEIATENYKVLSDYSPHSFKHRSDSLKLENARFGQQFSRAEIEQLIAFRQAPLPISISTAISDTADALQVSAKSVINVSPIINPYDDTYTEQSQKVAGIYKHLIQNDWYNSLGDLQLDRAVFDRTTTGRGLLYAAPKMDFGEFSVDIRHISWKYFFPDPASKDFLYKDMDNMVYAMPISKKAAYKFVQSIEPDLTYKAFLDNWGNNGGFVHAFPEEDKTFGYRTKDALLFSQRLTIERDFSYIIIPRSSSYNTGDNISYRTSSTITDTLKSDEAKGLIKIKPIQKLFLTEYTSVGALGYKIVYPITDYNIVPIHYDYRGTPFSYGLMWQLYPLQRSLNKFIMSSILNMALLNTTKILAEEDSIVNEDDWIQSASMPNSILKYRLVSPGMSTAPQIVKPTPMDSAFLQMPQFIIKMMEYVSSIYGLMQGNAENAPNVFSTVASLQSAGGQKIKRRQAHIDASLSHLGEIVGSFYREYAPMNGYSYHENESGEVSTVKYNELKVNRDEHGKVKVSVNPENDLRTGFKKVRFTSTGSMGYESATEAAMLTTLATQLSLPGLVPLILDRMNIPGIKDIKDSLDENKQLRATAEQLQGTVEQLDKKTKSMEGNIIQLIHNLEGAKAKGRLDVELQKFKDNPMGYLEKSMNMQGSR